MILALILADFAAIALFGLHVALAPEGWQDAAGFHYGPQPA